MFIYSTKQYLPTKSNQVSLYMKDFGYLYTSLHVYESGVVLSNRLEYSNPEYLEKLIKPTDKEYRASIRELYDILPEPVKPLAFMLYMTDVDYTSLEDQIGALDIILRYINPISWFDTPRNMRPVHHYSKAIRREYLLDWEEFFKTSIDYEEFLEEKKIEKVQPVQPIQQVVYAQPVQPVSPIQQAQHMPAPEPTPMPAEEPDKVSDDTPIKVSGTVDGDVVTFKHIDLDALIEREMAKEAAAKETTTNEEEPESLGLADDYMNELSPELRELFS